MYLWNHFSLTVKDLLLAGLRQNEMSLYTVCSIRMSRAPPKDAAIDKFILWENQKIMVVSKLEKQFQDIRN